MVSKPFLVSSVQIMTCKLLRINCIIYIPYRSKPDLVSASLKQTARPHSSSMADAVSFNYLSSFGLKAWTQSPRQAHRPVLQVTRGYRKEGWVAPGWPSYFLSDSGEDLLVNNLPNSHHPKFLLKYWLDKVLQKKNEPREIIH